MFRQSSTVRVFPCKTEYFRNLPVKNAVNLVQAFVALVIIIFFVIYC